MRASSILCGAALCVASSAAMADPITFAQVTENGSDNGISWSNNGAGSATLNTTAAGGDAVEFSFQNVAGLSSSLEGQLNAVMTINGGAGVTTTAPAASIGGYDVQAINAPMTISYNLASPVNGQTNLLTITITPNVPGAYGMTLLGQNGGTGAVSTTSQPTNPASSYTMSFSSAFLNFALNDPITAGYGYSSLTPMMEIASDGLLASFFAEDTGTFSSDYAPVVPEPAAIAVFLAGLAGLGIMLRMRRRA